MNLYLIGYMYCGKTSLGKQLARRLGYGFVDTDQLFEEKYHTSIPIFFQKYGEQAFRQLERQILQSTSALDRHVIACGGGTPCHFDNMQLINQMGLSVYLHVSHEVVCARMEQSRKVRPLLARLQPEKRRAFVRDQLVQREVFYEQASLVFEASGRPLDQLAAELLDLVYPRLSAHLLQDIHEE